MTFPEASLFLEIRRFMFLACVFCMYSTTFHLLWHPGPPFPSLTHTMAKYKATREGTCNSELAKILFIFISFYFYFFGVCVCACVGAPLYMGVKSSNIFFECPSFYLLRQVSHRTKGSPILESLASQPAPRIACLCLQSARVIDRRLPYPPGFYLGSGNPNFNSHTHIACTSPIEPSGQFPNSKI